MAGPARCRAGLHDGGWLPRFVPKPPPASMAIVGILALLCVPRLPAWQPALSCIVPSHDCDVVREGATVSNVFIIGNQGDAPLRLGGMRVCCGGTMAVSAKEVPPGSLAEIAVSLSMRGRSGMQNMSAYGRTDDPRHPWFRFRFTGRVIPGNASRPVHPTPHAGATGAAPRVEAPVPDRRSAARWDAPPGLPPVEVEFFFAAGCPECATVERDVLVPLQAAHGAALAVRRRDINEAENFLLLVAYQERLRMDARAAVSMVVDRRYAFAGYDAIRSGLSSQIALAIAARRAAAAAGSAMVLPPSPPPAHTAQLQTLAGSFTPVLVGLAGLADGLNPCAFATIIFLTTVLTLGGRSGRSVIAGGFAFCLASFATYYAMGLGLLAGLGGLKHVAGFRATLEWVAVAALAILGLLNLRDAARYHRIRDPGAVLLQLPGSVKSRIRAFALSRWRGPAVIGTGLAGGVVVTLLESVCTGQLYLPTLVLMSRAGSARARLLLLLYNAAFILPLLAVFALGAAGAGSRRLSIWSARNVVPSKLLLGGVFLALAVLLAILAA